MAALLRFALKEGVPFTKNQAERYLRPLKVKQKISEGWRSGEGAKNYLVLQSLFSHWRKRGDNVLCCLRELFTTAPALWRELGSPACTESVGAGLQHLPRGLGSYVERLYFK